MNRKPLIAHVLYRMDTGGMERIVVSLVNATHDHYRHALICLEGFSAFREYIEPADVPCLALHKKPGKDWGCYLRLWKALRNLKPDMVQTYNIGALDVAPIARLAGVRRVIHAEHGRDAADPRGESRKYRILRRWLLPFIDRYLAVSGDIHSWLIEKIGIDPSRVAYIPNGVDITGFAPCLKKKAARTLLGTFAGPGTLLIGTVGRLDPVKDQTGLVAAFHRLCELLPREREYLRLAIIGEGPQRSVLEKQVACLGLAAQVCLAGNRNDVPALLAEFDIFALSSIAEGMPVTLLEAMAVGLPVVATAVGGVGEVVSDGMTGALVPADNPQALATALANYVLDETLRVQHGRAGRERAVNQFSLQTMLSAYTTLYDGLLNHTHQQTIATSHMAEHKER